MTYKEFKEMRGMGPKTTQTEDGVNEDNTELTQTEDGVNEE